MIDNRPAPKVSLDLKCPTISIPSVPIPNWADQRLAKAYALIDEVMDGMSADEDSHAMLKAARDNVENADWELGGGK